MESFNLENWSGFEVGIVRFEQSLTSSVIPAGNMSMFLHEPSGQFSLNGDVYALVLAEDSTDEIGWRFIIYDIVSCDDARKIGTVDNLIAPGKPAQPWEARGYGLERSGATPHIAAARLVANVC